MTRFDQIERYLQGRMSAEELHTFEAEMAADAELAATVQQHRLERYGLELLVERDLLTKMQHWDRETELFQQIQPRKAVVRPMTWVLRIAAVLTLAALGYWLLRDTSTTQSTAPIVRTKPEIKPHAPTIRKRKQTIPQRNEPILSEQTEEIAQQDLPPAPIEEMATDEPDYAVLADAFFHERDFVPPKGSKGGTTGSAAYNQALKNFQDGRYNDVVSKVKPGLAPESSGADAVQQQELLALSQYQSKEFVQSANTFREIIASGKQPYVQRAEWGLTLALLQQMPNQKGLFYRALTDILRDPEHQFYNRAKQLEGRL